MARFGTPTLEAIFKAAEIKLNQEDLPWWLHHVFGYLSLIRSIGEGYGQAGEDARDKLEMLLKGQRVTILQRPREGIEAVYELYREMVVMQKAERSSSR